MDLKIYRRYSLTKKQKITMFSALVAVAAALILAAFIILMAGGYDWDYVEMFSYFGIVALSVVALGVYLYHGDIIVLQRPKKLLALSAIMLISFVIYILVHRYVSPYAVPYAFGAMLAGLVISRKSGFFSTLVVSLLIFFWEAFFMEIQTATLYVPLVSGIFTGIIGAYVYSKQNARLRYVFVAFFLAAITITANLLLAVGFAYDSFSSIWFEIFYFSALGAFLSIGLFFIATPILDTVFKFVTDFRLAELISTKQPLLKRLFNEAPGTFNHSITVANYADACASAIGENTYLARAAAYYHDIGKLKNASYFMENQMGGVNPHNEFTPELSVSIIKKHTVNGIALAKEHRLPEEIVKSIAEHHGTLPLRFFLDKAQRYSEKDVEATEFRYDGPKPTSKISAILMLADASEAALRANAPPDRESAEKLVQSIISERLQYGQFTDCDITMHDLEIIKQTIVTVYAGISHERIAYPAAKLKDTNEN